MKNSRLNTTTKNIIVAIAIAMMLFSFNSCDSKIAFLNSAVVPAAEGYAKVKQDKNNNYVIKIHLENLAESTQLQPPKSTYVVWIETDNNIIKNVGQIISSNNNLSEKLKASFESSSSFKPKKIFITAEDDVTIQYPVSQVVLTTDFF